ncbi:hypothetical protein HG531_001914 [Fusarium graminearum]|nr:hypothetical protein HG531_001914 [Fusarium graminearum]
MSSKVGSMLKTAVYALWSFQWGFFTATFCIYHELSIPNPFHAVLTTVLTLPIPLSLELFLLYTTASRFSCLDLHTRKFNTFFYKTRDWAMILPIFSILWFLCVLWWGLLAMMDMYSYGPVAKTVEFLCLSFKPIGYTVYIGGVLLYIPLPFWVIVTGTGACRRVRNLKSPEEEETTNLTTKNDDEEWNAFQDNRDPIARNDLDHLIINDAVISLRNSMILGLDVVSVSVGHGFLSVAEEVMVARPVKIIVILSRVGSLILEHLKDLVAAESQERTHKGPDVVDPVVTVEARDDRRTEGSGRVDGCARPVGRTDVGDEDGDTNADGGKMGAAVLLDGEEVDCQDELRSEEHLDEDTLSNACPVAESIGDEKLAGKECIRDACSGDGSDKLCRDDEECMDRCHSADEN